MFKKVFSFLILLNLAIASTFAVAKEPTNLALVKKDLVRYHDSGEYEKDLAHVINEATYYLKNRIDTNSFNGKKPAIVLDIDETSLSNYSHMQKLNFGGTLDHIREAEKQGTDPAITPTLKLYEFAQANKIAIIFLTGRREDERTSTENNLKNAGFKNWDSLILRSEENKNKPATVFKTDIRKKLTEQGYDIVLNIGDQESDLAGGYSDKTFKLPNPYYFIP